MTGMGCRVSVFAVLAAAMALWIAPQASAEITGSHIDAPTEGTFGIAVHNPDNTTTVSGTTTGGNPGTDKVDIVCTNADGSDPDVGQYDVDTALNGSFSIDVPTSALNYRPCILRAFPAGVTPANVSAFTGPLTMFGDSVLYSIGGGPNTGDYYDYYLWAQQHTGAFDYLSAGSCGVCDGYLFNANLEETATTFYANDYFQVGDVPNSSATRSEIRVDGTDAYTAQAANGINSQGTPFPGLTYSVSQNPANGDTTITESDEIVKCTDSTYPPDATKCATFVSTGVRLGRTIVQDHDGHLATVTDNWESTDASSHTLDLLPENDQYFHSVSGDIDHVEYQFPGQTSYSTHLEGDVVDFGGGAPGAVYIRQQGSPDDATGDGQGAIIVDRAANPATFTYIAGSRNTFNFHQAGSVPATGSLTFRAAYAQAYTCAEVASLAQTAAASFGGSVASPCPTTPSGPTASGPTGKRAAALKKCKKKHKAKTRKKCRKKAKRLPV